MLILRHLEGAIGFSMLVRFLRVLGILCWKEAENIDNGRLEAS